LRSRHEQGRHTIIAHEQLDGGQQRWHELSRQRLHFIEDDNGASYVMKLAAVGGFVSEQALEKLNTGGDDQWRYPILGGEPRTAQAFIFSITFQVIFGFTRRDRAVMLQDVVRPKRHSKISR